MNNKNKEYSLLFKKLWQQYSTDITAANDIHRLFTDAGESIVNDHIALRTFNRPKVNIKSLALPFLELGFKEQDSYDFPELNLQAKYFKHIDDAAPKVFISELICENFSDNLQNTVTDILSKIPQQIIESPYKLLFSKTPWQPLSYKTYQNLLKESQYAAWLYAYGYCVNHFTVNVNYLDNLNSIEKVNVFLKQHGYKLNTDGGEIKGNPEVFLEQSSIMAEKKIVKFIEGDFEIPSCYYEFAKRYKQPNGELYQGFIAPSAAKIFSSTHTDDKL